MSMLFRKIARYIPKGLLYPYMREQLRISPHLPEELSFCVAQTKNDLKKAYKILHDAYVENGYMVPESSGMRITKYFALPSTTTLVAKWKGEVVGTISIIRKTGMGLPIQKVFDISSVEAGGYTVAEVSSLAIDKKFRQARGALFLPLCKYFYEFAVYYMGIERAVIAVNPNMVDFYRGFLFFKVLDTKVIDKYDFANGAPAVGLWADFSELKAKYEEVYNTKIEAKNLFRYFTKINFSQFQFPDRQYFKSADPVMSPELFTYFFKQVSKVYDELDHQEKLIISKYYPYQQYKHVMLFNDYNYNRDYRFMVNTDGKNQETGESIKVVDISKHGLKVVGPAPTSDKIKLSIHVSEEKFISVDAIVKWINGEQNSFGLQLETSNLDWQKYISYLQSDFHNLTESGIYRIKKQLRDVA